MIRQTLALAAALSATIAFAGAPKAVRDAFKDVEEAYKTNAATGAAAADKACGVKIAASVNIDKCTDAAVAANARHSIAPIYTALANYCTDKTAKAVMKKSVKKIVLHCGATGLAGGTLSFKLDKDYLPAEADVQGLIKE